MLSTARHRDLVFGQHAGSDINIDLTATNPPELHFRYRKKKSHPRIYCRMFSKLLRVQLRRFESSNDLRLSPGRLVAYEATDGQKHCQEN